MGFKRLEVRDASGEKEWVLDGYWGEGLGRGGYTKFKRIMMVV